MASLTMIGYGWAILSFISAFGAGIFYYYPEWLINGEICDAINCTAVSFGTFRRCGFPKYSGVTGHSTFLTSECGRYRTFSSIPSNFWQISCVFCGLGCVLGLLVAFIALPAAILDDVVTQRATRIFGAIQFFSGTLILSGCAIYPFGWTKENEEVFESCGPNVDKFRPGKCQYGWALWSEAGCALLIFISIGLSFFAGKRSDWELLSQGEEKNDETKSKNFLNDAMNFSNKSEKTFDV